MLHRRQSIAFAQSWEATMLHQAGVAMLNATSELSNRRNGGLSIINISYQYRHSHYENLYNVDPCTRKYCIDMETGSRHLLYWSYTMPNYLPSSKEKTFCNIDACQRIDQLWCGVNFAPKIKSPTRFVNDELMYTIQFNLFCCVLLAFAISRSYTYICQDIFTGPWHLYKRPFRQGHFN